MKGIPNKSLGATLGIGTSGLNDPEDDVEAAVSSEPPILQTSQPLIGH